MLCLLFLPMLLLVNGQSELPSWINPIQDGIQVSDPHSAQVTAGQWTLLIVIDEPVKVIKHRCRRPRTWWTSSVTPEVQTTKPRTRRGAFNMFNFIGSLSNTLFGTATESQVKEMHETVSKLRSDQQRIAYDIARFTTVINQNALLLGKTQEHLKFLSTRFNSFVSMTSQQLRDVQRHVNRLNTRVDILDIIDHIDHMCRDYLSSYDFWLQRRSSLESGRLTEQLLPPDVLRNVLSRNIPDGAQPIVPISWYYRTLSVQPVTVGATLVYSVSLPLVSTYTWRFVEIHVWPYPVKNGSIELPQTVLHNTARDQVVINPQCMGEQPVVCTTHAIHMAEQYPCIQGLLCDIPFYDKTCYIEGISQSSQKSDQMADILSS